MKDELRKLIKAEAKRAGKNLSNVNAAIDKAEREKRDAARKAEQERQRVEQNAKILRIANERRHFAKLMNDARVKPSLMVELAQAFPPSADDASTSQSVPSSIPKDDGYFAIIGVTRDHNVFCGEPNRWMTNPDKVEVGTWRNGKSIEVITHIGIIGYQLDAAGEMGRVEATLLKGVSLIPTVRLFRNVNAFDQDGNKGKVLYSSVSELKADIADTLSEIYNLPNPLIDTDS